MATYWMTFRINDDAGYQDRYDGLISALNSLGSGFWNDPTSFVAFESELSIDRIAATLKLELKPQRDLVVIRQLGKDSTRYIGEPADGFDYFFPSAKKV